MRSVCLFSAAAVVFSFSSCQTVTFEQSQKSDLSHRKVASELLDVVFKIGDKNRDGEFTLSESYKVHPETNADRFKAADLDRSGGLSKRELDKIMIKKGSYTELISGIDSDSNGRIDERESAVYIAKIKSAQSARTFAQLASALD